MSLDTSPVSQPSEDTPMSVNPQRWITLAVVLTATFMGLLDTFIVNVSVPSIQLDLHASFAEVQFVLAGYTLAYAVILTTGGRLGDGRYGEPPPRAATVRPSARTRQSRTREPQQSVQAILSCLRGRSSALCVRVRVPGRK